MKHFWVVRLKGSSDFWCSRAFPMNIAIETAHYMTSREILVRIGFGEDLWKALFEWDQKQSTVSKRDT